MSARAAGGALRPEARKSRRTLSVGGYCARMIEPAQSIVPAIEDSGAERRTSPIPSLRLTQSSALSGLDIFPGRIAVRRVVRTLSPADALHFRGGNDPSSRQTYSRHLPLTTLPRLAYRHAGCATGPQCVELFQLGGIFGCCEGDGLTRVKVKTHRGTFFVPDHGDPLARRVGSLVSDWRC